MADPLALEISDHLARWRDALLPTGVNVWASDGVLKRIELSLNGTWDGGLANRGRMRYRTDIMREKPRESGGWLERKGRVCRCRLRFIPALKTAQFVLALARRWTGRREGWCE